MCKPEVVLVSGLIPYPISCLSSTSLLESLSLCLCLSHRHTHTQPTSFSLQARCQIGFRRAQVIFPSVLGLNRLLQVVCEKKMTVLICFLEIKRLVWKPLIIKVDVTGGLGTRGQRLRPQVGQCLAWGHQLACQCSPILPLPHLPHTSTPIPSRLLLFQEGPT